MKVMMQDRNSNWEFGELKLKRVVRGREREREREEKKEREDERRNE
jgi:hypothetical protein